MITQGFEVSKEIPQPWWFMVYYGVKTEKECDEVYGALLAIGAERHRADKALSVLQQPNTAHIFSNLKNRATVIALSYVTDNVEFMNSVTHELQHATAHICERFGIDYNSEQAGYIQGEIGGNLYAGVAASICPCCKEKSLNKKVKFNINY